MENVVGQPLNQTSPQQRKLNWKGASSSGKYKKKLTINIVDWLFSQLVWKSVKEKINETVKKGFIFIITTT